MITNRGDYDMLNICDYKQQIEKYAAEKILSISDKRLDKIRQCGNNKRLLEISYRDKKGIRTKRFVEPYKLSGDDFWGFDTSKNEIRRFKTKNVKGIKVSSKMFEPRWNIEMD